MQKFGFIQTFLGSFYNPEAYRDVVKYKKENTFGYLALVVLLCTIPLIIAIITGVNNFMNDEGTYTIGQLPGIRINNGMITMDKESPYFIKSKSGETIAVIDLSDSANIDELKGTVMVLLTKNKLISRDNESQARTYDLSKVTSFEVNPQKIHEWFGYAWIVYLFLFVFIVIGFYIYRLAQTLINAVIGMIISSLMKMRLEFNSLVYIAMVAITPAAVAAALLHLTEIQLPAKGWLGFILTLGYLCFGILANKPAPAFGNFENEGNKTPTEMEG
jgi:hypothetical protein